MPTTTTVAEGDCCSSLASKAGFSSYAAVYNAGENAELKNARPNPNMLVPGDKVTVPDLTPKEENAPTGRLSTFKVKIHEVKLRLVIIDENDKAVADKPYRLEVGGQTMEGKTPKNGCIEHVIPATINTGKLVLDPDAPKPAEPAPEPAPAPHPASADPPPYPPPIEPTAYRDKLDPKYVGDNLFPVEFSLAIGSLPSFNEVAGVQARLGNLGFDYRGEKDSGPGTTAAVKAYQRKYGGGDSGAPADIQDAIRDKHDNMP